MKKLLPLLWIALASVWTTSLIAKQSSTAIEDVPQWSKEVVWYQIFAERFRNGDPTNDPTIEDIRGCYPGFVPASWKVTPWTHDWYKPDSYYNEVIGQKDWHGNEISKFEPTLQLRRYGGDLQGVLDKLDYLEDLGITAIYFNPLNDAPSLHKYDARHWRHIDRNFGPTPREDVKVMDAEIPDDPSTWKMTGADQMFVQVIDECHKRGIRVVLDYSWNHTGSQCWAIKDVIEKREKSKYADWYWVDSWDDPKTEEDEFAYRGWFGTPDLPEIRETHAHFDTTMKAYEGDLYSKAAKQHIFNVSKRWLDPNGDGDPSDGVDGFRLDVAAEIGLGFWRDYREFVREINPDAYLIGEVWWEAWPDKLLDPKPYLEGDVFDAVMNYRWYRAARRFFAQAPEKKTVSSFVDELKFLTESLREQNNYAMMNLTASHDAPRVSTSLYNKNAYKFNAKPTGENGYKIDKPDAETIETLKLLLVQQFTYIGSPHIWAGDEMGMWGSDDPDCRKPLIWKDYEFENETTHPLGKERPENEVRFDDELFGFYKKIIEIRKNNPALVLGDIEYLLIDDKNETLAYKRSDSESEVLVVFNTNTKTQNITIPGYENGQYNDLMTGKKVAMDKLEVPARQAMILVKK